MKSTLLALFAAIAFAGCTPTPSNVHVVTTDDCGKSWKAIPTGTVAPNHAGNRCGYNVALPNWPMAGDAKFKTQFKNKVLTSAALSYTYAITNPVAFIQEARYLGKMGGSLEISSDNVGDRYEMAENIILDRLMREVLTDITRDLDIVDADPGALEDALFKSTAEALAKRGVTLADLALVIQPDDQTRLAIDSATAMRIYNAAGLQDAGKAIMAARAGATQINVGADKRKE